MSHIPAISEHLRCGLPAAAEPGQHQHAPGSTGWPWPRCIREHYDCYDGFVITHGTDTMAYTAAALSYLVQGSPKPIVLTGAQKPIGFDSTDSKINLDGRLPRVPRRRTCRGSSIVFNSQVILGTRAQKTRSKSFQAFSSINYPELGVLRDGVAAAVHPPGLRGKAPVFCDALDPKVALLKLTPGRTARAAGLLFWSGTTPLSSRASAWAALPEAGRLLRVHPATGWTRGKIVVLTTQVQNEGSDLSGLPWWATA